MKRTIIVSLLILIFFSSLIIIFMPFLYENSRMIEVKDRTVMNVIDGDTFEYYDLNSKLIKKVRLLCVDAPEKGENGYEESKIFLENLILGKQIILEKEISETDKYGRLLRYAYLDGIFINKLILETNHGKLLIISPDECKRIIN